VLTSPYVRKLLGSLAVVWVLTGVLAGGFSTFEFLDPAQIGRLILAGQVPYRDFALEYPPGAAVLLTVPAVISTGSGYEVAFRALMAGAWVGTAIMVRTTRASSFPAFLIASVLLAWLVGAGFDVVVALTVAISWNGLASQRGTGSALALSAGIAVKLAPAVLVPFALRRMLAHRSRALALVSTALVVSLVIPFALSGGEGDPLTFHSGRGVHAESLTGSVLVLQRFYTGEGYTVHVQNNAREVPGAGGWQIALSIVMLSGLLGLLWWKGDPTRGSTWVAALLAIPAVGPLASPQFLLWPVALVGCMRRSAFMAFLGAALLSMVIFSSPITLHEGVALAWLTFARNLALVVALVLAAREGLKPERTGQDS